MVLQGKKFSPAAPGPTAPPRAAARSVSFSDIGLKCIRLSEHYSGRPRHLKLTAHPTGASQRAVPRRRLRRRELAVPHLILGLPYMANIVIHGSHSEIGAICGIRRDRASLEGPCPFHGPYPRGSEKGPNVDVYVCRWCVCRSVCPPCPVCEPNYMYM